MQKKMDNTAPLRKIERIIVRPIVSFYFLILFFDRIIYSSFINQRRELRFGYLKIMI